MVAIIACVLGAILALIVRLQYLRARRALRQEKARTKALYDTIEDNFIPDP